MSHLRRASPLHAARASVGAAWCLALVLAACLVRHPLVLAVLLATVIAAAAGAGVARPMLRTLPWALAFGLAICLVNAVATSEGLTVVARLGTLPVRGPVDVTGEALAWGGVLALRAVVILCAARLFSAAVDPDQLLRAFRRVSFHSALTGAVATRMVPVLWADGRRMADAQRARGGAPASRLALVRAVTANAMDRSLDVAATLEVRGYGAARRPPRLRRPWSRHDVAFAASAVALVVGGALARAGAPFDPYPLVRTALDGAVALACVALALVALAPFLDRRGVGA